MQALPTKAQNKELVGDSIQLSLSGYKTGLIQWQYSADKQNWTDIKGSNNEKLSYIMSQSAYFRAKVEICSFEYLSDTTYIEAKRLTDLYEYESDITYNKTKSISDLIAFGETFTIGLIVKASKIFSSNSFEKSVLASFISENGTKYVIQYRKSLKKFAIVKTVAGNSIEVLSNPVQYNPDAIIALALQQTKTEVKLFTVIPRGIVIDFDDGDISVYKTAYPIMKNLGQVGTCHIICNFVADAKRMTELQLHELKNNGWVIDSHTMNHVDLTTLNEEGQYKEIADAVDWLKKRGFNYDLIATPFGGFNETTLKIFKQTGIKLHRGFSSLGYGSNTYPFKDPFLIKSDAITATESATDAMARVENRMSSYLLMHLTFHAIAPYTEGDAYHYDTERFTQLMNYIVQRGFPLYTFAEVADRYYDKKIIGNIEEFSANSNSSTSDSFRFSKLYLGSDENFQNKFDGEFSDFFFSKEILGKSQLSKIWGCKN